MKNLRLVARKGDILAFPQGISSAVMKEGATAALLLGHHVRIGSVRGSGGLQQLGIDLLLRALGENHVTEGVLANQPGPEERERRPDTGQIHQNVVGRTTGS